MRRVQPASTSVDLSSQPQSMSNNGARSAQRRLRCAVYTRKSTDEGLDQEFNSLDAQREACASFVASQTSLGWKLVPERYDDGGLSGGTMDRPALQRLLHDIRGNRIDVIVVYKIDRLTRSLADFAKMVEVFDDNETSFVSVTQQFNTTTSMGRLTLNVLLSFAQFEREVTAERIRDKIAASRKKGMWMGGTVPLGYQVQDRRLVIKEPEARFVRNLFRRYLELQSVPRLARQISQEVAAVITCGQSSRLERYASNGISSGVLYGLLANPVYIGKARHKGEVYDGEHEPLIDEELFLAVQKQLADGTHRTKGRATCGNAHLLTGILFDDAGDRMAPTHGKAHGKRYLYYVSRRIRRTPDAASDGWRISAHEIEKVICNQAAAFLRNESLIAGWVEQCGSTNRTQLGLQRAHELAQSMEEWSDTDRRREVLNLMFRSISLSTSAIRFEVNSSRIVHRLIEKTNTHDDPTSEDEPTSIEVPITLRRRANGLRIVISSPYTQPEPDQTLVDLVARAHVFLSRLTGASAISTSRIAERFGMDRADVGRILPLAFLSPAALEAILTGRQPLSLNALSLPAPIFLRSGLSKKHPFCNIGNSPVTPSASPFLLSPI